MGRNCLILSIHWSNKFVLWTTTKVRLPNCAASQSAHTVFPNPVSQTLYVKLSQSIQEVATIKILDIAGREIMGSTAVMGNDKVLSMDVSMLAQGMYFVKVITDKDTEVVVKFVKQ